MKIPLQLNCILLFPKQQCHDWLPVREYLKNFLLMFPETLSLSHVLIRYCTPDVMRCSVAYRPTIN